MIKQRNNKGITLVALVVTIIILIILASVTLTILLGNEGLIGKTKLASEESKIGKEKEQITLAYSEIMMDDLFNPNDTELTEAKIKNKIEKLNGENTVVVTKISDKNFTILYKDTNHSYNFVDGRIIDNNNINNNQNISGVKSVKDYGAVGDGITDDTVAFNLAMQSNEAKIYIPSGTYLVSGQVEVKNAKEIFGDGVTSVVKLKGDTPSNKKYGINTAEIHIFDILNQDNVTLKNFKLDANKGEYTNYEQQYLEETNFTVPLYILRSNNTTLENMTVCNGIIEGIYVGISNNVTVKNVTSYGNGYSKEDASGIHLDSCNHTTIDNLTAYENGYYGLLLTDTQNSIINTCSLNRNGYAGLYLQYNSQNNYINDVECKQNEWGVVFKINCFNNILNDFEISNNNETEMLVVSSYDNLLRNSTISNTSHNGIEFRNKIGTDPRDASYSNYTSSLKCHNVVISAIQGGDVYRGEGCDTAAIEFINSSLTNIWVDEANGTETASTTSKATELIPVLYYSKINISNDENKRMLVFSYDENKNFLWEEDVYVGSGEFYTVNEETKYIRIVIYESPSDNVKFENSISF